MLVYLRHTTRHKDGKILGRHWLAAATAETRFHSLAGLIAVTAFAVFGIGEAWLVRNPFVNAYVVTVVVFMTGIPSVQGRTRSIEVVTV